MSATFKQLTEFLVDLGIDQIAHTQKNYLGHLVNVYNLLKAAECDEDVCRGGLFHSIYGTEKFQGFKLPLDRRADLVELIGDRAERLAYWNCMMDRGSLDERLTQTSEPFVVRNRESGEAMALTRQEFDDLCCVHLFDWLEQAPRSRFGWDYRRDAYRQMAQRLGEWAVQAFERVYGAAPKPVAVNP
jgi:hypothetical protein